MMEALFDAMRAEAASQAGQSGQARCGIVQSADPASYCVRVSLQPEGVLTGWLPVVSSWVGAGWGFAALPSPGQQVLVIAQEGAAQHGIVLGGLFSDAARPPPAPVGELWLVHRSGSFLKLHNDGSVEGSATQWRLAGPVAITGTVSVIGDVLVTGDVLASGAISDQGALHGTVGDLRRIYDSHTHRNVQAGPDSTDLPTPQA